MAASGRVRPPGLESEVPEEETAEMKIEEKKAGDADKESLRSLERRDTDVRFQTVALISEIPRFTIGVICTATVDGDVPVSIH